MFVISSHFGFITIYILWNTMPSKFCNKLWSSTGVRKICLFLPILWCYIFYSLLICLGLTPKAIRPSATLLFTVIMLLVVLSLFLFSTITFYITLKRWIKLQPFYNTHGSQWCFAINRNNRIVREKHVFGNKSDFSLFWLLRFTHKCSDLKFSMTLLTILVDQAIPYIVSKLSN